MPTKKVAPKKKKPDKFVFDISDLKLIGQPVHKEFEGAPPAPPPHTATAHASGWHGAPGHGIFTGRVSNVDKASGYFTVSYEDGDDEVRLGVGRGVLPSLGAGERGVPGGVKVASSCGGGGPCRSGRDTCTALARGGSTPSDLAKRCL